MCGSGCVCVDGFVISMTPLTTVKLIIMAKLHEYSPLKSGAIWKLFGKETNAKTLKPLCKWMDGIEENEKYRRDVQFDLMTKENILVFVGFCLVVCTERSKRGSSKITNRKKKTVCVERASTLLWRWRLSLTMESKHGENRKMNRISLRKYTDIITIKMFVIFNKQLPASDDECGKINAKFVENVDRATH